MARARKKVTRARKRPAKRRAVAAQQSSSWTLGVSILGIAVLLGAAAYMISANEEARTTVAGIEQRVTPEIPDSVKQFPDQVRQQLPAMPSLTKNTPAE
jgi:hypothetical protein